MPSQVLLEYSIGNKQEFGIRKSNQIYLICEGEAMSTQIPPSISKEFSNLSKDTSKVFNKENWVIQEDLAPSVIDHGRLHL